MRLDNVDDQERYLLIVLIVKLVERGNLPPEWRSSVAAENEHHGLRRRERRKLHASGFVELGQREVWRCIARVQMSSAGVRPHRLKRYQEVRHIRHVFHDPAESFRRLAHSPPNESDKESVEDYKDNRHPRKKLTHGHE
jgi:hypothetical protein